MIRVSPYPYEKKKGFRHPLIYLLIWLLIHCEPMNTMYNVFHFMMAASIIAEEESSSLAELTALWYRS